MVWMDIWELRKSPTCLRRRLPFPLRLFFSTTSLPRSHFHLISLPPPFFYYYLLSSFFFIIIIIGMGFSQRGLVLVTLFSYFEGWILRVEGGGSWSLSQLLLVPFLKGKFKGFKTAKGRIQKRGPRKSR